MRHSYVFDVYLHGRYIDTLFYYYKVSATDVKRDLVEHDQYDPLITVRRVK